MDIKSKFTSRDFLDVKYNVVALSENQSVLSKFPDLRKYPEFNEKNPGLMQIKLAADKIFRYVLLMYTDNIIHRLIPEFAHRKREAALLAGFYIDEDGKFGGPIEKMFQCEYESVNDIIYRVISFSRSTQFKRYLVYNEALLASMRKLMELSRKKETKKDEKTNEKTKEIIQNIEDLSRFIEDLESKLTNEDTNANLLDKLYSNIEGINLGIRPEEIALLKKQGKLNDVIKEPK